MRKYFLSLLFFGILFIFPAFTQILHDQGFDEQKIVEKLLSSGDSSIIESSREKVYLNFDRLIFSEDGIFLESDEGCYYRLKSVSHDGQGYRFEGCTSYVCSKCGAVYFSNPGLCKKYILGKGMCGGRVVERWNCKQ